MLDLLVIDSLKMKMYGIPGKVHEKITIFTYTVKFSKARSTKQMTTFILDRHCVIYIDIWWISMPLKLSPPEPGRLIYFQSGKYEHIQNMIIFQMKLGF